MDYSLIIAAGGSGSRMETDTPKQFLLLYDKPVIIHTIQQFLQTGMHFTLTIIVCPQGYHAHCKEIMTKYLPNVSYILVEGGATRFHSIQNALKHLSDEDAIVAIHDAARPCVSPILIKEAYDFAKKKQSAVPVIPVKESIRMMVEENWVPVDRTLYKIVQTPQVFHSSILKEAYKQEYLHTFTDDATVVEKAGGIIYYINGEDTNIKITLPHDLAIAELYLMTEGNK